MWATSGGSLPNRELVDPGLVVVFPAAQLGDPHQEVSGWWPGAQRDLGAARSESCGETNLANTTTAQVLTSINQVSSRQTARRLITLGAEIRQHTTDSTALDLAHRISTVIAA